MEWVVDEEDKDLYRQWVMRQPYITHLVTQSSLTRYLLRSTLYWIIFTTI